MRTLHSMVISCMVFFLCFVAQAVPIPISTIEQLQLIGNDPAYPLTGEYELTNDIDASATAGWNGGAGFAPLGVYDYWTQSTSFMGVLDGQGYVIYNLVINRPGSDRIGLFSCAGRLAIIRNVGILGSVVTGQYQVGTLIGTIMGSTIEDCFTEGAVYGESLVGGLAGEFEYGRVTRCQAEGTVNGGFQFTGGLLGRNGISADESTAGIIEYCSSASTVTAIGNRVGGLVGLNNQAIVQSFAIGLVTNSGADTGGLAGANAGSITSSFASGALSGGVSAGGLAGANLETGSIRNCYATGGGVLGTENVGGLLGKNLGEAEYCYAAGPVSGTTFTGGLVGNGTTGVVNGSFWDIETSGQETSSGGTGKPTVEMKMQTTFTDAGWDFTATWGIVESVSYPYLQYAPPVIAPNLTGLNQEEAEDALSAALLTQGHVSARCDNTVPEGNILNQKPAPGTVLTPGSAVDYVLSLGACALEEAFYCPETNLLYGQELTTEYTPVYFLSDEFLAEEGLAPWRFDTFAAEGQVCDLHWWGVEVNSEGNPCERAANLFVVQISPTGTESAWEGCEITTEAQRAVIDYIDYWNGDNTITLPVYRYDVWHLPSCCELPESGETLALSIRSAGPDTGIEDDDCYFGWMNSPMGDGSFIEIGEENTAVLGADLAFCLTDYFPAEGEGEGEGEGEIPLEGEGELPEEGEGEIPPEGEIPVEGEPPVEGEGETPVEGEGETPVEGEGEIPVEGEGEAPVEGEGETPAEGEGEVPLEGEGEIPLEGEGEIPSEGEGEVPVEGEGEIPVEGEGEVPAEGEGEVPAEGEGEIPAEGEGEAPVEGEGETPVEGEGETPIEGEGETPVEGEGETPLEGEGEAPVEGEGESPLEGEGEVPVEGEGEIPVEGEGEIPLEGEGETPVEGEGEIPIEGEGEVPAEGEGEAPAEGEGEIPLEGEGETPVEGEGEIQAASLTLDKTADVELFSAAGDLITYTLTITNTGDTVITNIVIKDPLTNLEATMEDLVPGEHKLLVTEYLVTEADVSAAQVRNTATVSGKGPGASVLEDSAECTVPWEKESCCSRFSILNPANLFVGALALLALIIAALFMSNGDLVSGL